MSTVTSAATAVTSAATAVTSLTSAATAVTSASTAVTAQPCERHAPRRHPSSPDLATPKHRRGRRLGALLRRLGGAASEASRSEGAKEVTSGLGRGIG
jgi:hypothetical protein